MAAIVRRTAVVVCRQHGAPSAGVGLSQQRSESTQVVRGQTSNLAAYKRGRGGRSSFSGIVATVLGSSGFLGKYVVNRLGKVGSQVICPYRGEPYFMKDLKLAGDLGQILFLPYDLRDEASLRKVMKYSNVVVNLVGRDWETKRYSFDEVNNKGARRIARIAKEMGVEKFVHFSHLNASPEPMPVYNKEGSGYLRSKYYGEMAVREEFPEATIMKPSDMYGPEDRFIRYYADSWRRSFGTMPLWNKGTKTVKMPVFFGNVAEGVINAIMDPEAVGRTYECVGPNSYLLSELIDYFYRVMRYTNFKRTYMTPVFKAKVAFMENAPSYPILNFDKLEREHISDVLQGFSTLEDLNVNLMRLENRAPFELKPFRKFRYYEEKLGEFSEPDPPVVLS